MRANLILTPTAATPTYPWLPGCNEVTIETRSGSWYENGSTDSKKTEGA